MHVAKRAFIGISRQWKKSLALCLALFILGSMASGGLAISRAIHVMEVNLRRRIPPLATLIHDEEAIVAFREATGEWGDLQITQETIEEIGGLHYVRAFDYSLRGDSFFSRYLRLPTDPTPYLETFWGNPDGVRAILESLIFRDEDLERIQIRGIFNHLVLDIENGVIELVQGRVFSEEEIQESKPVALVSQAFARENHLSIGSYLPMEHNFYEESISLELEVVGIFRPSVVMDSETNFVEFHNHMTLNNRVYAPIGIPQEAIALEGEPIVFQDIVFILNDSLELEDFYLAASDLLPEFWKVYDLTGAFSDMSVALSALQQFSDWILFGAVGSSLLVLGLLVVLFLSERKQEIGIYLGLGEKRINVAIQLFLEVLLVGAVALVLALFNGHFLASHLSHRILIDELAANGTSMNFDVIEGLDFNSMGLGFWLTHEEMMEAYEIPLDYRTILSFVGTFIGMIVLSMGIPLASLTRLNPKEILMKSSLG